MKTRTRFLARMASVVIAMAAALPLMAEDSARPFKVGLYSEPGCTDAKSREAAWRVLGAAPGIRAERITSETVRGAALGEFDVVVLPGGTGSGLAKSLRPEGIQALAAHVAQGHGMIGICAGGYFMARDGVQLLNTGIRDGEHWARGEAFVEVRVLGDGDAASTRTMWFENGPLFTPGTKPGLPPYVPLARFVTDLAAPNAPRGMMTGSDAVIAGLLGKGRVVGFSSHPELSPTVNHWLVNAARWTARTDGATSITAAAVLEGKDDNGQPPRR